MPEGCALCFNLVPRYQGEDGVWVHVFSRVGDPPINREVLCLGANQRREAVEATKAKYA
jgi:hypothetical protein